MQNRSSGDRIRGRGFLPAPEGSYIPHLPFPVLPPSKKHHPAQTATASKPPLQEFSRVAPKVSVPGAEEKEQMPEAPKKLAPEAPSLVVPEALEAAIPAHMTPLHVQLGGTKRNYQCQVEGCSEGLSTSWPPSPHMCAGII